MQTNQRATETDFQLTDTELAIEMVINPTGRVKVRTQHLKQMLRALNFYAKGGNDGGKIAQDFMNQSCDVAL